VNRFMNIIRLWFVLTIMLVPAIARSAEKTYEMVGREYTLLKPLKLKGVKLDLRANRPDYLIVVGQPGIAGPELIELGDLAAGSRIEIVSVYRKRGLFSDNIEYEFISKSPSPANNEKVRIHSNNAATKLYSTENFLGGIPVLSPIYFEEVK